MERVALSERPDWREKAESFGFSFHTIGGERYWDESGAYRFSLSDVENIIEDPTAELHEMAMDTVDFVCNDEHMLSLLNIPADMQNAVRDSWIRRDPHLYGRMDLSWNGVGPAKLLELNYDTPTSLYEAAFFQWLWLEDSIRSGAIPSNADQFNSIQDKLIEAFGAIAKTFRKRIHFASCEGSDEDAGTVGYLRDCAHQAGLRTFAMHVEDIGAPVDGDPRFLDNEGLPIDMLFKLYPLEQMFEDDFARFIPTSGTQFIEPLWKSVLSNKGILPVLWARFPDHPNLLESHFEEDSTRRDPVRAGWVRKPLFSREGANIEFISADGTRESSDGEYSGGRTILQKAHPLPLVRDATGNGGYPVIGSWVVGDLPAGMGVREDNTLITRDTSRFVPHFIS